MDEPSQGWKSLSSQTNAPFDDDDVDEDFKVRPPTTLCERRIYHTSVNL